MKQTLLALLIDNSGNIAKKGDTFVQGVAHEGIGIIADGDSHWHNDFPAGITFDGELIAEKIDEHKNIICTDGSGVLDKTKWSVDKYYGHLLLGHIRPPFVLVKYGTKAMTTRHDPLEMTEDPRHANIFNGNIISIESAKFACALHHNLLYPAHVEIKVDFPPAT